MATQQAAMHLQQLAECVVLQVFNDVRQEGCVAQQRGCMLA